MKTGKKILALLLVCALALSMTACGSLSAAKTIRKLGKLESYHADLNIDLGLSLDMMGESLPLDFLFDLSADCNTDPFRGEGELRMVLVDEESDPVRLYLIQEDDGLTVYSSADSGKTWTKSTLALGSSGSGLSLSKDTIALFAEISSAFEKTGTETINGYEATVYSGEISGELLHSALEEANFVDSLSEALELEPGTLTLDEVGSIPVTVALDNKSDLPVRITADLSELMDSLFPFFLQAIARAAEKEGGAEGEAEELLAMLSLMEVSFDRFLVTLELKDFDAVGEVSIPDEVVDAARAA